MISERLKKQMSFIFELEKLKTVYRQNGILGGSRQENSAEHSWHISVMALLLSGHCAQNVNHEKIIKMLLIHDIVEIHTGDTFLYDEKARKEIQAAEKISAEKIFGLLPEDQKNDFLETWTEFETAGTEEAKWAKVLDNLQPILNHYFTDNQNIKGKKIKKSDIIRKKEFIKKFSPEIWEFALGIIDKSVEKGLYLDDEN